MAIILCGNRRVELGFPTCSAGTIGLAIAEYGSAISYLRTKLEMDDNFIERWIARCYNNYGMENLTAQRAKIGGYSLCRQTVVRPLF
jgi:hypothetical protein